MGFLKHKNVILTLLLVIIVMSIILICGFSKNTMKVEYPKIVNGVVNLSNWDFNKHGSTMIGGEWEIHDGIFLPPEMLNKSGVDKAGHIAADTARSERPMTFRAVLNVKQNDILSIGIWHNANYMARIWINGKYAMNEAVSDAKLLHIAGFRDRKAKNVSKRWNAAGMNGKIEIVIQASAAYAGNGLYLDVDTIDHFQHTDSLNKVLNLGLLGALVSMAMYHFIFYYIRKSDKALLYIGTTSASMACLFVLNYFDSSIARYFDLQYSIQTCFMLRCLLLSGILLSGGAFTNALYTEEAFPKVYKVLCMILKAWCIVIVALYMLTDIMTWMNVYNFGNFMAIFFVAYYCVVVTKAFRHKREGAGLFLASYIFTAFVALHDVLVDWEIIKATRFYYYYGLMFVIISMAAIMAMRFSTLYEEQEESAAQLSASHAALRRKNEELQGMWQEVNDSRDQLASLNSNLEMIVGRRTATVRNLLDNAGQGFLSFDTSLVIEEDCSLECEKIFGESIRNKSFIDLISKYDAQEKDTVEQILDKVLKSGSRRNVYLTLLPQQIQVQEKLIKLEYKVIADNMSASGTKMMVILTDITEKHALENALEMKRKHLEMVVKVVVHPKDFHECVQDYKDFCSYEYKEILEAQLSNTEKRVQVLRKIHTMKGNFAQFELAKLVEKLHRLEDTIIEYNGTGADMSDFEKLIDVSQMLEWLDAEIENLESILGRGYVLKSNIVSIEIDKLIDIENRIREMFPDNEGRNLLKELRKLRYRPLRELLEPYMDYCLRMAEKLDKNLDVKLLAEDGIMVDSERYHDFIKSLVHVFRNAVDHGIESGDERMEFGKIEMGTIQCNAKVDVEKQTLNIEISDDGRGINSEVVLEKALQLALVTDDQAKQMDEQDIIRLILKDSFSTSEQISLISGRGVGLGATAAEVERLGGSIVIKTDPGEGTTFIFSIPME